MTDGFLTFVATALLTSMALMWVFRPASVTLTKNLGRH